MREYNEFQDKTILVTGGAGCVGSNLTRKLADLGAEKVIILDNMSSAYHWNIPDRDAIQFVQGDILSDEDLKRVFKEKPDYVYHLAAHFANQNSVDEPETDLMVNGIGILKVLEHAQLTGVDRFIYSSSGCGVYGLESKMPFEEHDISISLHTPYQVTKLLGELYTNYFHNLYDVPIVNARFFNVFGPGEVPGKYRNVIPNFFYWAMNGQPLPITGEGTETRDWTFVDDICNGLLAMAIEEEAIGEAINLGSGQDHRVIDMANRVNELSGNEAGIEFKERRNWDAKTKLLSSIEKAKDILGYKPTVSFDDGLVKVHDWFETNWDNIQESAEFD
ncbi:MAG: NAD-dependent epimerase/dehydratase family protein [Methanobrevibacter sp.]|jgi:nucleoside-diphosphate-sugar epimerase|nr:NAD-dependent epimerase/dehydratase family protein [Methanobrevibacter sp.]MDO5827134.1 NAD-dependent epimerase/dehydratase family protein [Methanobrevibacter sp.]MEE0924976.1 NAD-dependent epimerase/dehydratase family protein [Methanobrevibacter sp.]MEE3443697.1 NAD-dependent epimerase/dehydratase family protein [Methanobrevibacter sp.]